MPWTTARKRPPCSGAQRGEAAGRRTGADDSYADDATTGLFQLACLVQGTYARVSERHDLTPVQARLLCILADGPRGMAELARCFEVEKAALTGLIDRAERRGLVKRSPVPGDRRALQCDTDRHRAPGCGRVPRRGERRTQQSSRAVTTTRPRTLPQHDERDTPAEPNGLPSPAAATLLAAPAITVVQKKSGQKGGWDHANAAPAAAAAPFVRSVTMPARTSAASEVPPR